MAIRDAQHETIDRERLEELQLRRLGAMLARIRERVPFYRSRLDDAGFEPGDLTSLDDVAGLPFTEKTDFRDNYPYGLFAVPMSEVVEIHSSSGTTGKAGRRRVHESRSRDLGRARLPARRGRRRPRRRRRPDRLRVRHVHRRLRPALRAAARRRGGAAHQCRQHRAPAPVHEGLRHDRAHRHAVLRALHRRGAAEARRAARRSSVCASGCSAPRRAARRCARRSRAGCRSGPQTTTDSPRLTAPAWPASASAAAACTSPRTTSSSSAWTRRPASRWRTARSGSSWSPR